MINIVGSSRYQVNRKVLKEQMESLFSQANIEPQQVVNVVFVGKRKMKDIATTYKNEAVALPVLAFPYNESVNPDNLMGEIIVCYPQSVLLAAERNKRVEDMIKQLIEHAFKNLLKT